MAGQQDALHGKAALPQPFADQTHMGRRPREPMNQQNAVIAFRKIKGLGQRRRKILHTMVFLSRAIGHTKRAARTSPDGADQAR